MPLGFPAEGLSSALDYMPRRDDIFVSTYPKCGTTWVQYIVYLLMNQGRPMTPGQSLGDVFPHLEEVGREAVEALAAPRLMKTHLPRDMAPFSADAKYIYVARNPFDCAVSFYHHTRGFVRHYDFAEGSFDEFFACFIEGAVDFGDYFDNLMSWYPVADRDNVLFLTYEDLRADATRGISEIGRFLGGAARACVDAPETLAAVLRESSFEHMRRDQRRWSSERPSGMPEFVRKGVVGDWQSLFSAAQARRLADKFVARTQGSPAAGLWPDILAAATAHAP